MEDPFGILARTLPLTKAGPVSIDATGVHEFARKVPTAALTNAQGVPFSFAGWTVNEKVAIILAFNAVNFSFWPDWGKPRWTVRDDQGKVLDGSTAAFWCLENAFRKGILDPLYFPTLSRLSGEYLADIFRGQAGMEIPMLGERLAGLHALGEGIPIRDPQSVRDLLESWDRSAVEAVEFLVARVPHFRDVADLGEGYEVPFYKRAQLAISMIDRVLIEGKFPWFFADTDSLTAFADYRLPQILREVGILVYSKDLAEMVDGEEEIPSQSVAEVCLRASTIWAVEYLRREIEGLHRGIRFTAAQVDNLLWHRARELKDSMRPHHRTRTIAY